MGASLIFEWQKGKELKIKSIIFPPFSIFQLPTSNPHLTEFSFIHLSSIFCILLFCILDSSLGSYFKAKLILHIDSYTFSLNQNLLIHSNPAIHPASWIALPPSFLPSFLQPTICYSSSIYHSLAPLSISPPTRSLLRPFRRIPLLSFAFSIPRATWDP